jgi:hypothetical protein
MTRIGNQQGLERHGHRTIRGLSATGTTLTACCCYDRGVYIVVFGANDRRSAPHEGPHAVEQKYAWKNLLLMNPQQICTFCDACGSACLLH